MVAILIIAILRTKTPIEGFAADILPTCPSMVSRDPSSNEIVVRQSGTAPATDGIKRYPTVAAYANAMAELIKRNPVCVIMPVPEFTTAEPPTAVDVPTYSQGDIETKRQMQQDQAEIDAIAADANIQDRTYLTKPPQGQAGAPVTLSIRPPAENDDTPDLVVSMEKPGVPSDTGGMSMMDKLDAHRRDWSSYPPSAKTFGEGSAAYAANQQEMGNRVPPTLSMFNEIQSHGVLPPDSEKLEAAERKALTEYGPRTTASFWETPLEEVQDLISQQNKYPGFTPQVVRTGPNQFQIAKLIPNTGNNNGSASDSADSVPRTAEHFVAAVVDDPYSTHLTSVRTAQDANESGETYFDKWQRTAPGKVAKWSDYTKWTPGLERAFQENAVGGNWYE